MISKKSNHNNDLKDPSTRDESSAEEKLIAQVVAGTCKVTGVKPRAQDKKNIDQPQQKAQISMMDKTEEEKPIFTEDENANSKEDIAQEQIADLSDRLARALAEVENTRRRFQREKQDALRYGASQLAISVFEVADNLKRARNFVSKDAMDKDPNLKNLVLGITMTEKSLGEALKQNNITTISPKKGEPFSAREQEAISESISNEVPPDTVIETVQVGYKIDERLLRPAQVIIAKGPEKNLNENNNQASHNGEQSDKSEGQNDNENKPAPDNAE